jgi:hypothetical protein
MFYAGIWIGEGAGNGFHSLSEHEKERRGTTKQKAEGIYLRPFQFAK